MPRNTIPNCSGFLALKELGLSETPERNTKIYCVGLGESFATLGRYPDDNRVGLTPEEQVVMKILHTATSKFKRYETHMDWCNRIRAGKYPG